jgi:AGCS family alanine or glycine:cation symporter
MAIGFGGPGAIVWMWIIAFFGAGTAYAEACLAQIYKQRHGKELRGGPAYYIEQGLRCRWLAVLFAAITVLACALCLPPIHSNSIAMSFATTFHVAPWVVGVSVATLIALVVLGGVKRISAVAEIVTPFMAIAYILLSIAVLFANASAVPAAFHDMIASAFGMHEALGGIMGSAVAWGVKRGIYSNEAGQGTAPIVAAAAKVDHPVKQGLVQGFSVYVDTLLVCTATAVMLLATKCYNVIDPATGGYLVQSQVAELGQPSVEYTIAALGTFLGRNLGGIIISITLFFFAFTTVMAYYYYAETNLVYLFGKAREHRIKIQGKYFDTTNKDEATQRDRLIFDSQKDERRIITVLRVLFIGSVLFGSLKEAGVIWSLGDMGVGLMAWINIIAILLLSPKAFRILRDYERQQRAGIKNPKFDPKKLNFTNADFWE